MRKRDRLQVEALIHVREEGGEYLREHLANGLPQAIERYRGWVSGSLLDRIDMHAEVPSVALHEVRGGGTRLQGG